MTETLPHTDIADCALVLFTKRPRPGIGKQRVAASEGVTAALELSQRLFDCALEDLADWPGASVICIADASDTAWAQSRSPGSRVLAQHAGNLGERLQRAARVLAGDYQRLLFIGCDAPTIDTAYLLGCARSLQRDDVVLGAALDGGVVVMGTRAGWPPLADLPWSTPALGDALATACAAHGQSVATAAAHRDIDDAADMRALATALNGDTRPARQALHAWLANHIGRATQARAAADTRPY